MTNQLVLLAERLFKVKIVPTWRAPDLGLANHLRSLFNIYGIRTALDVGANIGQFGLFLRNQVGFSGEILSFEPDKMVFDQLLKTAAGDAAWHCFPFALGAEDATKTLNIMKGSDFNSMLIPVENQMYPQNEISQTLEIPVRKLDSIWSDLEHKHDMSHPYLKIDTQGFDLNVLIGAALTLEKIAALQTEMSVINIYENMPTYRDVLDYVESRKFELSYMHPVTIDGLSRIVEFDGVFVNSKRVESS